MRRWPAAYTALLLTTLIPLLLALPCRADALQDIKLRFPLYCHLGNDCFIYRLPDVSNGGKDGKKMSDFTCGAKTSPKHNGTDFALGTWQQMQDGVDVLAAADGIVERVRNGEEDTIKSAEQIKEIEKSHKNCGNGIMISHGNNITTQYCHLKKNSVKVAAGDKVKAGDVIAQIGLSGISQHPHLHFTLLFKNEAYDPFTALKLGENCNNNSAKSLWVDKFNLDEFGPYMVLLQQNLDLRYGYFNAQARDKIDINIINPQQKVIREATEFVKDDTLQYKGKLALGFDELQQKRLIKGKYTAVVKITRIMRDGSTQTASKTTEIDWKPLTP